MLTVTSCRLAAAPLASFVLLVAAPVAVVRELAALMLVVQQWPRRRDACVAQATTAATAQAPSPALPGAPRQSTAAVASSATERTIVISSDEAHALEMLAWLGDHTNMEARTLQQLVSLKPRVVATTGSGIFSGAVTGPADVDRVFQLQPVSCKRSMSRLATTQMLRES